MYEYNLISPTWIEEWLDGGYYNIIPAHINNLDEINKVIDKYGRMNLAEYIDSDNELIGGGIITSIELELFPDEYRIYARTKVEAAEELDSEQKRELMDYIEGQYSDGYGSGLEQQEFGHQWEEEDMDGDLYTSEIFTTFHLWDPDHFDIWFE